MIRIAISCLSLVVSTVYAADLSSYFNDAKSYGGTFNPGIVTNAKDGAHAESILPMYGTTSPEATLMGDGKTSVISPSVTKVNDCAASPADPDPYKRQECDAINFWQKNPSIRPKYTISRAHDPVVSKAKTIRTDPVAHTGAMPGISGSYGGCTNKSIPGTPITIDETCESTYTLENQTCERTRAVEVKAEHDYQCDVSNKKNNNYSCDKILIVEVTLTEACTHGTWVNAGMLRDTIGNSNVVQVDAYCDHGNTDTLYMRFTPLGYHGVCRIGYAYLPRAPFTVSPDDAVRYTTECGEDCIHVLWPTVAVPAVHWKGSCTVAFPVGLTAGKHGCIGNTCTYKFWGPEAGVLGTLYPDKRYIFYGRRWNDPPWNVGGTTNAPPPGLIATTSDTWDNQCATLEARSE